MRAIDPSRFPNVVAALREAGVDPATELVPVAPASHYVMGGVVTNLDGRSSVPGLYAVGEVACTGLHGANRLASNSLSECFVFGRRAALDGLDQESARHAGDRVRHAAGGAVTRDARGDVAARRASSAPPSDLEQLKTRRSSARAPRRRAALCTARKRAAATPARSSRPRTESWILNTPS